MALFLFFLAPKEGSEKWIQWKKVLGIIIFLNQAFYWVSSISDGTFTLQESLPLHMCGFSQLMLFVFLAFDVRKGFSNSCFLGPFGRDPSIPHPCFVVRAHMALYPSVLSGTQLCGLGPYLPYGSRGRKASFWHLLADYIDNKYCWVYNDGYQCSPWFKLLVCESATTG